MNRATAAVLAKLADAPRIGSLGLQFSRGWDESIDRKKGRFDSEWGVPESWDSVILQGPHLHVGTPFYKSPNPTMLHNQDWTPVDLEALPPDTIPATQYKPRGDRATYDTTYTRWDTASGPVPARNYYRIAWRAMAATTGERTLIATIVPPGTAHPHTVSAMGSPDVPLRKLVEVSGYLNSLILDFAVRAVPKSGILKSTIDKLPIASDSKYSDPIIERTLRLCALTSAYARLWEEVKGESWSPEVPFRAATDRRRALFEIDALVALALNVNIEDLVTVYRTQFPVLFGYDHNDYLYDANGRLVLTEVRQAWKKAGEPIDSSVFAAEDRTAKHPGSGIDYTYELPFRLLDREQNLREAYAEFECRYSNSA